MRPFDRFRGDASRPDCWCDPSFVDRPTEEALVVDADDCPGAGALATEPACRATVVDALADRDADTVRLRRAGVERVADDTATALWVAAGRFVDRVRFHDEGVAATATTDPLAAAREATGRAGPAGRVAAETGLAEAATRVGGYDALRWRVGLVGAWSRVDPVPPGDATLRARRNATVPDRHSTVRGPAGPVVTVPDASPAYLTLAGVDHERAAAVPPGRRYRPLSARNVNLFTVPYDDAADAVVRGSSDGSSLRAAGETLVAAGRLSTANGTVRDRRRRLDRTTDRALDSVTDRADRVLDRRTELSPGARRSAIRAGLARWGGTGRRALAAANGSLADAVAAEALERAGSTDPVERDRLATALRSAIVETARAVEVSGEVIARTARTVENAAKQTGYEAASRRIAWDDLVGESDADAETASDAAETPDAETTDGSKRNGETGIVVGLPVAPGYWYLTVNVWTVTVRGAYARFAVRTRRGTPGRTLRYVRDGSRVTLDVDEDGVPERLGRDRRVAFETNTSVVVAVPPGGSGVGDTGGDMDERSTGWPRPACLSVDPDACAGPGVE